MGLKCGPTKPCPYPTLIIPAPTCLHPYPGFASWRSCSSDFLFPALQVGSLSLLQAAHIIFTAHDFSDIALLLPSLWSPNFLSASNCLRLEMAAHQQILIAHIFLLPLKLLFLYYYNYYFYYSPELEKIKWKTARRLKIPFFLGRGDNVWGTSLIFFSKKEITSSYSHVLISIININMMK